MTITSTRNTTVAVADPFRVWCGQINPQVLRDSDSLLDQIVAPPTESKSQGSLVRDEYWIFPSEWFPSGPDRLCLSLSAEQGILAPETHLMLKQYAIGLMVQPRTRALVTIKNHVDVCRRIIGSLAVSKQHGAPLSSVSFSHLSQATDALTAGWAVDNSDRFLLKHVVSQIAEFRKRGWLSDGFGDASLDLPITDLPLEERQRYFDEINKSPRVEGVIRARSQRGCPPVPKEYVDAMLPVAILLIDELSPFIIAHARLLFDARESISKKKGGRVCKKRLGKIVAAEYSDLASRKASNRFSELCEDYRRLTGCNFSLASVNDLRDQMANLQMGCYQVIAVLSAARKGEMHGLHPDGLRYSADGELQLHGRIRKGAGAAGYRKHAWTVDELARDALQTQWDLFEPFRNGEHLWCQTAMGSIGAKMRGTESEHLKAFVERNHLQHHLDEAGIAHTGFRKAWATLMYLGGVDIMSIARQLGHTVNEEEEDEPSVTMGYINSDPFTRAKKRLQSAPDAYRLPASQLSFGGSLMNEYR
ncbi:hypothetical protein V1281_004742 [Nitrobacteraceae bacterium AZCC 2161]